LVRKYFLNELPNTFVKMKPVINKKFALQLLSVGLIRLLLIGIMILSISFTYSRNSQKTINSSSLKGECLADSTENYSSSINRKKAERFLHPIVIQAACRHQVDAALVKAIIMAESGYNTRAISKKGAKGLMQLMPATAQALGVEDAFNPKQNISGGVRYFKQLVTQFDGDVELALAAYNAGSRNVRHYQGIPPFKATRYYIKKVFKYYEIYKDQMAYTEKGIAFLNNSNHYS
jgi:soluble lytic murein transglycosylase-like protein